MIAHMTVAHGLDSSRVYVTGLSAGGAMAAALLATYPDVFAGGAIIAGLPYGTAGNVKEALAAMAHGRNLPAQEWGDRVRNASPAPKRRPTIAIWHGDADTTVALGNALESARQWTDVLGLHEAAAEDDRVDGMPHRAWRDQAGVVKVEMTIVPGLGHGTPIDTHAEGDRGVGQAMPYILDAGVSSTWRIARTWNLVPDVPHQAAAEPQPPYPASVRDFLTQTLRFTGCSGRPGSTGRNSPPAVASFEATASSTRLVPA